MTKNSRLLAGAESTNTSGDVKSRPVHLYIDIFKLFCPVVPENVVMISLAVHSYRVDKEETNKVTDKPVGDWISEPSTNFVAMATRVGSTFCMVPFNPPSPKTPW